MSSCLLLLLVLPFQTWFKHRCGGHSVEGTAVESNGIHNGSNNHSLDEATAIHKRQIDAFKQYIVNGQCKHIYLDLGTNIGVQLRKLYQPDQFKWAKVHELFNEYFDHNRTNVCALGVEANPGHAKRLLELQEKYQSLNYPMVILTSTAVSVEDGVLTFFYNGDSRGNDHQWGGSVSKSTISAGTSTTVISLDISRFLKEIFSMWQLHRMKYNSSKVVAKIDIEGEEFNVIPHMLNEGTFCKLDLSMVEWHPHSMRNENVFIPWDWGKTLRTDAHMRQKMELRGASADIKNSIEFITRNIKRCRVRQLNLDDETYAKGESSECIPYPDGSIGSRCPGNKVAIEGKQRHHRKHGKKKHSLVPTINN